MVRCPNCKSLILQKSQDGKTRLRGKAVVFDGARAFSVCPGCKTEVDIPVVLNEPLTPIKHFIVE